MRTHFIRLAVIAIWMNILGAGCAAIDSQYAFCNEPQNLSTSDIVGEWTASYSDVFVGKETLTFFPDGTYQQYFELDEYTYSGPRSTWSINRDHMDSPKLVMNRMKYFAEGLATANDTLWVELGPQSWDRFRIQESGETFSYSGGVSYPGDGFVYLYPRRCGWRLVLQQMVWGSQDPDNQFIRNPVFRRQ